MTLSEFYGCSFMAFGPALAMFCLTIAVDPIRIVIIIACAFFWLLSLLISSLVYLVLPGTVDLPVGLACSVMIQEIFRFIVYKILRYSEPGLQVVSENGKELIENKHILAYVAGLGFGLMSGMFALVNVLADSVGPATVGLLAGSQQFFMTSAAFTLLFILLHVFWSVIFFSALDQKNYKQLAWVVLTHFVASGFTFFNGRQLYAASLIPCIVIVILNSVLAFKVVGGTWNSLRQSIRIR